MNDDLTGIAIDVGPAEASDAIDGVRPGRVAVPHDAAAVAGVLAHASQRGLQVVVRGGGTKLGWGRPPARVDLLLDMRRLNRVLQHERGDLTVTVEAGLTLGALNEALRPAEQWLPLDPPFAGAATIGGLLATNDSGPHRHRFGTPRDLVIGVQLATGDGVLASAGGRVVKNVAGYDLSKLVSGSFGSLAAIVSATFKLAPLPPFTGTLAAERLDTGTVAELAEHLAALHLEPVACEVHVESGGRNGVACLMRFASVRAAVEAQLDAAATLVSGSPSRVLTGRDEARLWSAHDRCVWDGPGAVVKASWLPADLPRVLAAIATMEPALTMIGRMGTGAGVFGLPGEPATQAQLVTQLRECGVLGNVTIVRGSVALKRAVDVWPPLRHAGVPASVKRALDPHGILGAGRGPGG